MTSVHLFGLSLHIRWIFIHFMIIFDHFLTTINHKRDLFIRWNLFWIVERMERIMFYMKIYVMNMKIALMVQMKLKDCEILEFFMNFNLNRVSSWRHKGM